MNDDVLALAEAALAAAGHSMMLVSAEELTEPDRRNRLVRCRVAGADIETVVIKQRGESAGTVPGRRGILRDGAALALLSSIPACDGLTPRFYAIDAEHDLLVVEDLGTGDSLVEPLLGDDAARAEAVLLEAARVLARIHGYTIGRQDAYQGIRSALGSNEPSPGPRAIDWPNAIRDALSPFGIEGGDSFLREAGEVLNAVHAPGPFFGLVHGDPCPDNWMQTPSGLHLFDFEFSGFGSDGFALVTIDAVYPRMCFPSCWCAGTTPEAVIGRFEAAYRSELATTCPAANDDALFDTAMLQACGAWFLSTLSWHLLKALNEDPTWGRAGIRSRVLTRTDAFLDACKRFGRLHALEEVARQLHEKLRPHWPETDVLPIYPAFG